MSHVSKTGTYTYVLVGHGNSQYGLHRLLGGSEGHHGDVFVDVVVVPHLIVVAPCISVVMVFGYNSSGRN